MKFDNNGMRIGTAPPSQVISSSPFTQGTIVHAEPEGLVQVDAGILPKSWGMTTEKGILLDVQQIAKSCIAFNRYYPQDFPLEESILDGISEATAHELTHFIGKVEHTAKSGLTIPDFYNTIASMGHPIKLKMWEKSQDFDPALLQTLKPVAIIDLPDEPEAPQPKEPFSTFQVGNMVLKVRND